MMQIPRRKLTGHEHELLETVRYQVIDAHQARKDELKANVDRAQWLVDQLIAEAPNAVAAIESAKKALKLAEIQLADVDSSVQLATEELAFIAGHWSGFIAGMQFILGTAEGDGPDPALISAL